MRWMQISCAALLSLALLAGCGGGGSGGVGTGGGGTGGGGTGGGGTGGGGAPATTATVPGTAAIGKALTGATISIKDAEGKPVASQANAVSTNGSFAIMVSNPADYKPPFILRADPTPNGPEGDEHYGILLTALDSATAANNRANITPLTSLILYEATKRSLSDVFGTPALYKDLTREELDRARDNVIAALGSRFPTLRDLSDKDLLGQSFVANGRGYDQALDELGIVRIVFDAAGRPELRKVDNTLISYDPYTPLFPVQTIALTPQTATQTVGGTLNPITATVTDTRGKPAKRVRVTFSTTAGDMTDVQGNGLNTAVTDANGVARLWLRSPFTVGSATVTARSDDHVQGQTTVSFLAGSPASVGLNLAPDTVRPGGPTLVTVAVLDANGNPVADGHSVRLRTTSSSGGSFAGGAQTVVRTTQNGFVVINYTAGSAEGTEMLSAEVVGAPRQQRPLTVAAALPTIAGVSLTGPATPVRADGATTATLTARVLDAENHPVPGVQVGFTAEAGILSANSATTDTTGTATVTLRHTEARSVAVRASASGFTATALVQFSAGSPAVVGLNARPNAVKPRGQSTLVASVLDANGNPVSNETVRFEIVTAASGVPQLNFITRQTDANGYASVVYTAGNGNGTDQVRVTTSNGVSSGTVNITVGSDTQVVGSMDPLFVSRAQIRVEEKTLIRATVRDTDGDPMAGVPVEFRTSAGTFGGSGTATVNTDARGVAEVEFTAGTRALVAQIAASARGFSQQAEVRITAGAPHSMQLSAAPDTVRPGGSAVLYAYVTDQHGNPVTSHSVSFAFTQRGSGQPALGAATQPTNQDGVAQIAYTAGAAAGTDTIRALAAENVSASATVTVDANATVVGRVDLTSGAASVQAGGSVTLRARVLDIDGRPVANRSVSFTATAGSVPAAATTDAQGYAEVTYTSPSRIGQVRIVANASGILASVDIQVVSGPPQAAKFNLIASPATIGLGESTTLTAIVLDAHDNPVPGVTLTFDVPVNASGGTLTPRVAAPTSNDGITTVTYTAGQSVGADTVRVTMTSGESRSVNIAVTGASLHRLSIATDRVSVRSDGSDAATITVTALSAGNVAVPNVRVHFSADGGLLNQPSALTDAQGQARVSFRADPGLRANANVTITASAAGAEARTLVIQITGSTATLGLSRNSLMIGVDSATVTVTARDAGGNPIYDSEVVLSQEGTGGPLSIVNARGRTDANGRFTTTVSAPAGSTGPVTLRARVAGATATALIEVGGTFLITRPAADPASLLVGGSTLEFEVTAPGVQSVRFGSSLGTWSSCNRSACVVNVFGGKAIDYLSSTTAVGLADVEVEGLDANGNVVARAKHKVAISGNVPAKLMLTASATNLPPSQGEQRNTVTLVATVLDATDQPVDNAAVAFSIERGTGSGEAIEPVLALTSQGQARATFSSGSLPSGQTQSAVRIRARALANPDVATHTVDLTIGGGAGMVAIGEPSSIDEVNAATYRMRMALLVADTNGNPMPNRVVSLSAWPTRYAVGYWRPQTPPRSNCEPQIVSAYSNEDSNENLIQDAGEPDSNGDGQLTPPNSAAGALPSSVITDTNGVATFDLIYLKQYAAWVETRIRASTLVHGSVTTAEIRLWLPYMASDAASCVLPNSPF